MDRNNFQSVAVEVSGSSSSSASLTFSLALTETAHYCSKQQFGTVVYTSDRSRTYCQDIIFYISLHLQHSLLCFISRSAYVLYWSNRKVTKLNQSFNSCAAVFVCECVCEKWDKHGRAFPFCNVSILVNRSVVNAPISCSYSVWIKCQMKNADIAA